MKKKAIQIVFTGAIVLFIIFLLMENTENPYTRHLATTFVPIYLEAKGYLQSDIAEAGYAEPQGAGQSGFYPGQYRVVFKDEPQTIYYYGITKRTKEVRQFCAKKKLLENHTEQIIDQTTRNSEVNCVTVSENR